LALIQPAGAAARGSPAAVGLHLRGTGPHRDAGTSVAFAPTGHWVVVTGSTALGTRPNRTVGVTTVRRLRDGSTQPRVGRYLRIRRPDWRSRVDVGRTGAGSGPQP